MPKVKWSKLSAQEMHRIANVYVSDGKPAIKAEAAKMGISHKSLLRSVQAFLLYQRKLATAVIPEPTTPPWDQYTVIREDNFLVLSDIEVPDQDSWMLRAALLTAMKLGIKTCIWNGDVIATDQSALNAWANAVRNDGNVSYEGAVGQVYKMMSAYGSWFDHQYMTLGNHDNRLGRATGGEVQLYMLLRDAPVDFSIFGYMYVFSPAIGEWIYISHPKNFSKAAAQLAKKIYYVVSAPDDYTKDGHKIENYDATKHGKNKDKCHIILGHTHQQEEAWSDDGNYRCVSLGCIRDPRRTHYKAIASTKYPEWNQGFGVWMNGEYRAFSKFGTDWKSFLGESYEALSKE